MQSLFTVYSSEVFFLALGQDTLDFRSNHFYDTFGRVSTLKIRNKVSLLSHRRVLLLAFLLVFVNLGMTVQPAHATPVFQMPFPCNEVWHASTYANHGAIDWNAYPNDNGRTVVASASGTASVGYDAGGWGNYVLINHGGGWQTRYAHLQNTGISGAVSQGQIIGQVGNTGNSSSSHLHWEQIYNGVRQTVLIANGATLSAGGSYSQSDPTHISNNSCGGSGLDQKRSDFNGDGKDDVAWHQGSGTINLLNGNGSAFTYGGANIPSNPFGIPNWAGAGNVDGAGSSEAFWYHSANSTIYALAWNGSNWVVKGSTGGLGTPDHAVTGDFNGDGKDDVAWHQGANTLHLLTGNGTAFTYGGANSSGSPIGIPDWAGAGNVDGSGQSEVYWYHSATQTLSVLRWNGAGWSLVGSTSGLGTPDHAVVGDFDNDGKDDVAWHHGTTLTLLRANGLAFTYGGGNPSSSPIGTPDWSGAGNVDGIGQSEVYWYQSGNSTLYTMYWTGSGWNIKGSTGGIGLPNWAVSAG